MLPLVLTLATLAGSVAHAAPRHHHKKKVHKHKHHVVHVDEVAVAEEPTEEVDAIDTVTTHAKPSSDWHFAFGPNMWLASVDAKVALGGGSDIGAGVDFVKLGRHTKYAVPVLAEARYGRFSVVGDLTYASTACRRALRS